MPQLVDLQKRYPQNPAQRAEGWEALKGLAAAANRKIVVLDDDPTGVQTVHGVHVYTRWDDETILAAFESAEPLFFLLTNSRAFSEAQTAAVHRQIAGAVLAASRQTGRDFLLVSRGDSTLRGHYPLETDTLRETLAEGGCRVDGEVLMPFFRQAGRYTVGDVHYVAEGGHLLPAASTEFARDKTFGYQNDDLKLYIEEKTRGAVPAGRVKSVSLDALRATDLQPVVNTLAACENGERVVVNALGDEDAERFAMALYTAMAAGKRFLVRCAASLVKALGAIEEKPLLRAADLYPGGTASGRGGILVAGSHTAKTTAQLAALDAMEGIRRLEFDISPGAPGSLAKRATALAQQASTHIAAGRTVLVYTSRTLYVPQGGGAQQALAASVEISDAVQAIVAQLAVAPKYVLAKGGITSSDIGVKALGVKKALVLGQVAAGIPVWQTDADSRFPGIPYIIFPGNVGGDETLHEVVRELER